MKTFTVKVSKEIFDKIREDPLYHTLSDSEIRRLLNEGSRS